MSGGIILGVVCKPIAPYVFHSQQNLLYPPGNTEQLLSCILVGEHCFKIEPMGSYKAQLVLPLRKLDANLNG